MSKILTNLINGIFLGVLLGLTVSLMVSVANAGPSDQYRCVKVKKKATTCKTKVVYRTKTKVIERPVQQIVMRTKNKTLKNRVSLLVGKAYDSSLTQHTETTRDHYGRVISKDILKNEPDKVLNLGVQYERDLYQSTNYGIHGLIQFQQINGVSLGLGISF